MRVSIARRREIAEKVRETMGALGSVELDGIPLADLIEPEECDGCEPGAWEVVAMEAAERLGVAVGGCLPSDYADAIGEALDRRLMPEGTEWPRFEDGEPVRIGDAASFGDADALEATGVMEVVGVEINLFGYVLRGSVDGTKPCVAGGAHGERVRRPAVLAADGEPLEVGQTVWHEDGSEWLVEELVEYGALCFDGDRRRTLDPSHLTHQRPVLDADGVPIKVGDTVWLTGESEYSWTVTDVSERHVGGYCNEDGSGLDMHSKSLTHTEPEPPDSWERVEDDATLSPEVYCHRNGIDISQKDGTEIFLADTVEPMARDLVRRCRALAERSE